MSNCLKLEEDNETVKERTLPPVLQHKEKNYYRSNIVAIKDDTKVEQNFEEVQSTSDSGKEYDLEQQFEDTLFVSGNVSNSKQKQTTQRMKLKAHNIIANDKANVRLPFYFKLDRSTTLILEMLIDLGHSGEFHNVVGRGTNSIVIHAHCYGKYHIYFPCGNAIKIYKLSNSVEKNNAIYKRVQRENEHLLILREKHFSNNTPHPVQKNKNVIMMSFIGSDQETAPSITVLPSETLNVIYCEIVKEIETWYKKLGLIHGNLSASNILYWMDKLHFIGWSHSVRADHPSALKKLMKDCHFVTTIFRAWIYLCVTMLAMLLYAVFSLHTENAPTAGICVCITAVTHTVLYAMTVLLSSFDPFPILGFTIVAALECAYVGNELALMSGTSDVPYREPVGPTDCAIAALNLHIDYYYFITEFLIPKCR